MEGWADTDHLYRVQAWRVREGLTAAQGVINVLEVMLYMVYVEIVVLHGDNGWRGQLHGKWAARAVLVGFGGGVVNATKSSLYCTLI